MIYLLLILTIGVLVGTLIWFKTKKPKYVLIYAAIVMLLLLLPWILLVLAFAADAEFPD